MKKLAVTFALSLVASSAFAWGIPTLPSVPTPSVPSIPSSVPDSVGAPSQPAAPAATSDAPAEAATPVFKKSCSVVRGEAWKKMNAISYQPDPMHASKFVSKEKLLKVLEDDGFTCEKSKIGFDKNRYDAKMVCNKPYTGGGTHKWLATTIQCKGDTCDEPGIYCSEGKTE